MRWLRENWLDFLIFLLIALVAAGIVLYLTGINPFARPRESASPMPGPSVTSSPPPSPDQPPKVEPAPRVPPVVFGVEWPVTEFALVRSELKPRGPVYTILEKFPLRGEHGREQEESTGERAQNH
ncbi:hypothetical protein CSW45_03615 [Thermus scotoductus]|uniref:Uncharacterized protein n=1 Tax=Thermus scotoductus TaxID=37636 RepID=A0A430RDC0_THESC|nr:hypothetical protein CSW45_03615 [Thermus scotoductus]